MTEKVSLPERKERLKAKVEETIQEYSSVPDKVRSVRSPVRNTHIILIIAALVNVMFFFTEFRYSLIWVVSAFILLMVNPVLLLLPTRRGSVSFSDEEKGLELSKMVKERHIDRKKIVNERKILGEMMWNLFFINCQPLAPGFIILFILSVVFALFGWIIAGDFVWFSSIIIVLQSVAIIAFYAGVLYIKPHSPEFFNTISGIRQDFTTQYRAGLGHFIRLGLSVALLIGISGIVVISAFLLPGQTLAEVLVVQDVHIGWSILPFLIVFLTQVIILRYFQGIYSRNLVCTLVDSRTRMLRDEVLTPLETLITDERESEMMQKEIDRLIVLFRKLTFIRFDYHDIFGFFPVFALVPDIRSIIGLVED